MQQLKARVLNGRLKLDEPTDLPEGSEVPLEIADGWDELDAAERALLHQELEASITEHKSGAPTFDAAEVLAALEPVLEPRTEPAEEARGGRGAATRRTWKVEVSEAIWLDRRQARVAGFDAPNRATCLLHGRRCH